MVMITLNRTWRQFVVGFTFAVGGAIIFLYGIFGVFLINLFVKDFRCQRKIHRKVNSNLAKVLFAWLEVCKCMKLQLHDNRKEIDTTPEIIIANHPTYIDFFALLILFPQVTCVVKSSLLRLLPLARMIKAAGYVENNEELALIDSCAQRLLNGESLLVFPEGTRSGPEGLSKFKRGAAALALKTKVAFRPVVIRCDQDTLQKEQRWYDVPDSAFTLSLEVCDKIEGEGFWNQNLEAAHEEAVRRRNLTLVLESFFKEKLSCQKLTS